MSFAQYSVGIFSHHFWQYWHKLSKVFGCFDLTRLFSVFRMFSIGLRLGLCESYSNTFTVLSWSHFLTARAVCLWSLSCWKIHMRPSFNFLTEDIIRIIPSTFWSLPMPAAAKHPHNMIPPPPCFVVGIFLFGWNASPSFGQTQRSSLCPKTSISVQSEMLPKG